MNSTKLKEDKMSYEELLEEDAFSDEEKTLSMAKIDITSRDSIKELRIIDKKLTALK